MTNRLHFLGFGLLILTGACTPEKNETDTDASTGADTGTDTGSDTSGEPPATTGDEPTTASPTSDPGDDVTTAPNTSDATMTGDPATDTGATDGETENGQPVEIVPECVALCDKLIECMLAPNIDGCAEGCSEEFVGEEPECVAAMKAHYQCLDAQTCETLQSESACAETEQALDDACAGKVCSEGGGGGPGECEWGIECEGEPGLLMKCDDTTCTCTSDGVETGSCAAEAACEDRGIEQLEAKAKECCGF